MDFEDRRKSRKKSKGAKRKTRAMLEAERRGPLTFASVLEEAAAAGMRCTFYQRSRRSFEWHPDQYCTGRGCPMSWCRSSSQLIECARAWLPAQPVPAADGMRQRCAEQQQPRHLAVPMVQRPWLQGCFRHTLVSGPFLENKCLRRQLMGREVYMQLHTATVPGLPQGSGLCRLCSVFGFAVGWDLQILMDESVVRQMMARY